MNTYKSSLRKAMAFIAVALMACVTLSSCQDSKEKLNNLVKETNKHLPQDVPGLGSLVNMGIQNDQLVINFDLDDINNQFIDVNDSTFNFETSEAKESMILGIANNLDKDDQKNTKLLIDAEMGMRIVFKSMKTNKTVEASLTPQELRKSLEAIKNISPKERNMRQLNTLIKNEKAKLPMSLDNGLQAVDEVLENETLTYTVVFDEELFDTETFQSNADNVKNYMLGAFGQDFATQQLGRMLVECGVNLAYKYVGNNSGEGLTVILTPAEIQSSLRKNSSTSLY
ncbi:MAG: hypothetical protein IK092_01700 [Muribaculaceae bacterium]|nr:hypothetical protein [Muribaculaceae bacterium]